VRRVCDACERSMRIVYRDQEWDVKGGQTARAAIKKVDLDPEAVLVVRDGQLVTDDTILEEGDQVKLIAVISGGAAARQTSRG
jgi:sulfur carrier protein ThiS